MPRPPCRCIALVSILPLAVGLLAAVGALRADPLPLPGPGIESRVRVTAPARVESPAAPRPDEAFGEPLGEAGGAREAPLSVRLVPEDETSLREHASEHLHRRDLSVGRPDADHDDGYLYRLPYGDGVSFAVLQGYGARLSHRGSEYFTVDFRMSEGTLVHAAREGTVVLVEDSHAESCWTEGCGRFANFVVVLHADGTTGEYFHLQRDSVLVAPGERIERGQALALSGNTGYSTAPHLHFGVYRANADGSTQSIAVRFLTRGGLVAEPRSGARYLNASAAARD